MEIRHYKKLMSEEEASDFLLNKITDNQIFNIQPISGHKGYQSFVSVNGGSKKYCGIAEKFIGTDEGRIKRESSIIRISIPLDENEKPASLDDILSKTGFQRI